MMRTIHRHMDADQAERYLIGGNPEEETEEWEDHLLVCTLCQERVSTTDDFVASMSAAAGDFRRQTKAGTEREWQLSSLLPIALALALLVGILALLYHGPFAH